MAPFARKAGPAIALVPLSVFGTAPPASEQRWLCFLSIDARRPWAATALCTAAAWPALVGGRSASYVHLVLRLARSMLSLTCGT